MTTLFKNTLLASAMATAAFLGACNSNNSDTSANNSVVSQGTVAKNFRRVASAMYSDSLATAKTLDKAVDAFIAKPSDATLAAAKAAYKQARVPYQQSEIMRFDDTKGNVTKGLEKDGGPANVDDWEGQVNAWPLDEALIDYVDSNTYVGDYADTKNIINTTTGNLTVSGKSVDVTNITPAVIASLNEIGGSEANVATGVHAIEFLLWGQDTNGTKAGSGNRPVSDYFQNANCTSGATKSDKKICERRAQYLKAASDLLVSDLTEMNNEWTDAAAKKQGTLAYDYLNNGKSLKRIIESIGDMSAGELASERMRISVLKASTEDEHDCFSDLTHVAILNNAQGIINAYRGSYTKLDGTLVSGPSLRDLIAKKDSNLVKQIDAEYEKVMVGMKKISDKAEAKGAAKLAFDQQIAGSTADKQLIKDTADIIDNSAELITKAATTLGLKIGPFDSGTCDKSDIKTCSE